MPGLARAQDDPALWVSPTPDETGTITVIVQPNESLWGIAARAGLTVDELLVLNGLTESAIIQPGDVIIIAIAEATPTPEIPEAIPPTATLPIPTVAPTTIPPRATICLSAFDDLNQDGMHDGDEALRAGVAFTVYDSEQVVANYITDGVSEPHCLEGLTPGEYHITRSKEPDELLTTDGDWVLYLARNSTLTQAFGSLPRSAAAATETPASDNAATSTPDGAPVATPAAATPETDPAAFGWQLAGVASLFVGGLLLLVAVLILLRRRMGANKENESD